MAPALRSLWSLRSRRSLRSHRVAGWDRAVGGPMIGVVLSGQRFAPLVRYLLHYSDDAPRAVILDTNLSAPDRYALDPGDRHLARETAAELGVFA